MTNMLWLISSPLVSVRLFYSIYFLGMHLCHGHMLSLSCFTAKSLILNLSAISGSQFKVPSQTTMSFSFSFALSL